MDALSDPRKDQIHRVACKLFREHGFHGTSVRAIAENVGIRGGSLYAHIESKDDLLWDILNHAADRFFAALTPILEADLEVMQKLRDAIVAHVGVITADLEAAALYTMEWRHLSPERREIFKRRRDEYEHLFRSLVAEAIRARYLAAADAASASLFILSTLNWVYSWFRPDGRMTSEEVGQMLADYILDGLRRRTA